MRNGKVCRRVGCTNSHHPTPGLLHPTKHHSSVLPLAWAFSVTGVVAGFTMLIVVALANTYTCDILLHAARITGTRDYEGLAFAVGGKPFKVDVGLVLHTACICTHA